MKPPEQTVVCRHKDCIHHNIERPLYLPKVGYDLFLSGQILCICNNAVEVLNK